MLGLGWRGIGASGALPVLYILGTRGRWPDIACPRLVIIPFYGRRHRLSAPDFRTRPSPPVTQLELDRCALSVYCTRQDSRPATPTKEQRYIFLRYQYQLPQVYKNTKSIRVILLENMTRGSIRDSSGKMARLPLRPHQHRRSESLERSRNNSHLM